jgi:hypothetical protein
MTKFGNSACTDLVNNSCVSKESLSMISTKEFSWLNAKKTGDERMENIVYTIIVLALINRLLPNGTNSSCLKFVHTGAASLPYAGDYAWIPWVLPKYIQLLRGYD